MTDTVSPITGEEMTSFGEKESSAQMLKACKGSWWLGWGPWLLFLTSLLNNCMATTEESHGWVLPPCL